MGRRLFVILLLTTVCFANSYAQEPTIDSQQDLDERTMALDLRTATYFELVAWCERLDLSTLGSRSELQKRLEKHYEITPEPVPAEKKAGQEIVIESADGSRYYDIEEPPETYLQLLGDVTLLMTDDDSESVHRISSDRIVYNQTINTITASGNLTYIIEQKESTETFTGESLTVNLDDWRGVFIKGTSKVDRTVEEEELVFFYSGNTIYRLADDTIIMQEGNITSSTSADPYYHIDADRIWVLGPGEWALRNAVLYVGRVPLFYFPFFFYPGNELILHPSTGYRDIEGYYLQLTGYIIGKREKSDSSLSFLQVADDSGTSYRTEPWSIYLQKIKTEDEEESEKETTDYLKVIFDIYTRLGLYAGLSGDITPDETFESLSFDIGLARSRDVFPGVDSVYTYLSRNDDGEYVSRWNSSSFLGINLPVRFGWDLDTSVKLSALSLTVAFPMYSDPWFLRDFSEREERIDWASLLGMDEDDKTGEENKSTSSTGKLDRFTWRISGRLNPQVTELRPYIQSISLNKITASVNWKSKALPDDELPFAIGSAEYRYPERAFFVPDSFILPALAGRISGSLIPPSTRQKSEKAEDSEPDPENRLVVRPPWGDGESEKKEAEEEDEGDVELTIPSIQGDISLSAPQSPPETRHTLTYSLAPDFSIDSRYLTADWVMPQDIDFKTQYSVMNTRANGSLQYKTNFFGTILGIRNNLGISGVQREHYGGSASSVQNWDALLKQDMQATYFRVTDGLNLTISPLVGFTPMSKSTIQYALTSILYQNTYDAELEEHKSRSLEWDKEVITAHSIGLNAIYSPFVGDQKVSFSAVLPPLDEILTYKLISSFGPVESTLASGWRMDPRVDGEDAETREWNADALKWTEKFSFPQKSFFENTLVYNLEERGLAANNTLEEKGLASNATTVSLSGLDGELTLSETFTYDFLEKEAEKSVLSLKAWWFTLSLQAGNSAKYTLVEDPAVAGRKKWEPGEASFIPTKITTAFNYNLAEARFWKNRISVTAVVNTSWALSLIRPTDSALNFNLSLDLEIAEFLQLSISSKSVNKASYRYVPSLSESLELDWLNPVVDVARSFNFFNEQDRIRSFFNLENISVSLVHPMPDWELEIDYSGTPELREEDGNSFYEWAGEISFFVRWKPIPEIKRKVTSADGEITF
jgi:hypothetical protein